MYRPGIEEAIRLTGEYRRIPVSREILSDIRTPMEVLSALMAKSRHCFILESMENPENWGRYTFLGFDPRLEISCTDGNLNVTGDDGYETFTMEPGKHIRRILQENESPRLPYLPPFSGGLVGYFSYDYLKYQERSLSLDARDEEGLKDVDLMLFDKVIAFDNLRQKISVIVSFDSKDREEGYAKACREIEDIIEIVRSGEKAVRPKLRLRSDFHQMHDRDEFCRMVEKAKDHIREGDIFQVVLSNRMHAEAEGSLLDTYRMLRTTNPSPYMFYLGSDDMEIAGASPETLVTLRDGVLKTFPLAGTRPRGKEAAEDERLKKELLSDKKELSEHNMLVDLGRNDLGRISEFGSVVVEEYLEVLKFSHVMHIGSTVKGTIRKELGAMDAIEAVLPAGTLSGAPKIRACEIINGLEDCKRGLYGGAIGYLDFSGNMDTCIAIRTAFKKNGRVFVRSGAGIVADSVPESEFLECANKARAVIEAIKGSQEV
ncbi:anthranilate synthase component I family protein [Youngiibacter fragilis]|uniref:Anthranilate synthase component 1 n=1 Tax=Youngiibacter fragilis 232.1 TaxID=994573 RepID=V7HZ80_9CLOT|nr:anthranilate synthase component I family protein [Youngiibacter fragilis]ETA79285.1 anthranilate synthase subunit I [Youngiibacter fragilis 232.1]